MSVGFILAIANFEIFQRLKFQPLATGIRCLFRMPDEVLEKQQQETVAIEVVQIALQLIVIATHSQQIMSIAYGFGKWPLLITGAHAMPVRRVGSFYRVTHHIYESSIRGELGNPLWYCGHPARWPIHRKFYRQRGRAIAWRCVQQPLLLGLEKTFAVPAFAFLPVLRKEVWFFQIGKTNLGMLS